MAPTLRSLRERLRPPRRLRATPGGRAFVGLTLAVGAAAMNTGNNLLYLALAMNLSLVVLSGLLSERALRRVRGEVLPAGELYAGAEGLLVVRLDGSGKRGSSPSLAVVLLTGEGTRLSVPFPDLPPGGAASRVAPFLPARRGPCRLAAASLSTTYPFGLFEKSLLLPSPPPFLVYPSPAPWRPEGHPRGGGGRERRDAAERSGDAVAGVRERLPGDALRDMHWKATARLGRWMAKEREREAERRIDVAVGVPCAPERLEGELSRACGALLACLRAGRPFRLAAGPLEVLDDGGGGARRQALSLLARLRPDGSLEPDPSPDAVPPRPAAPPGPPGGERP